MKDLIEKVQDYIKKYSNKKIINNLFIFLLILIIFLIIINNYLSKGELEKEVTKLEKPANNIYSETEPDYNRYLENKLSRILSKIDGVGEVDVMITLEDSEESIIASNSTILIENILEDDGEGGTREVNREDVNTQALTRTNNGDLLVVKKINPNIQGVIVIAQGAKDLEIKEILYEAVKTALGVKGNRVQVFSSK